MGEIVSIFRPERWVREWRALGGICYSGEGPWGENGTRMLGLGTSRPDGDMESHPKVAVLEAMVGSRDARIAVAQWLHDQRTDF